MKAVWSIFRFVFLDNLRSTWSIVYLLFFAVSTYALIYFTGSYTRSMVSIMNIIILIAPLVSTMMTSMYYFNKTDFVFLLLSQPVKRTSVFLGIFLGVSVTQSLSVALGLMSGMLFSASMLEDWRILVTLIFAGILLSLIFSSLSLMVSVASRDKLRGIGISLSIWLFMAVIYDGLMLMYFIVFSEYPIEEHAIILSLVNPIDLSRIFTMLQLDVSALMGYSGAVFRDFFGNMTGVVISIGAMLLWILLPLGGLMRVARKKDY